MSEVSPFSVVLFESVSHAMQAEKIMKAENIPYKLIPVPRHLSSDCGVCIRFGTADRMRVEQLLADKIGFFEIAPI